MSSAALVGMLPPLESATMGTYPLCRVVEHKAAHGDSPSIRRLTYLGTCFAVSPVIVLTTAHHYNAGVDMVEHFAVAAGVHHRASGVVPVEGAVARSDVGRKGKRERDVEQRLVGVVHVAASGDCLADTSGNNSSSSSRSPTPAPSASIAQTQQRYTPVMVLSRAAYLQASARYDALILWLDRPLPHWMPLRGRMPRPPAPITTAWYHQAFTQHPLMLTSGATTATSEAFCSALGCVTDKGSSGAPVLCSTTGVLIGMHLGSNVDDAGVRHTEFIPARTLLELIISAGVQTRLSHYSVVS